jgi:hypothetical protein
MITIPFILTIITVTAILIIKRLRSGFRFFWFVSIAGALSIFISLLVWIFNPPLNFSLSYSSEPSLQLFSPIWITNSSKIPIIISLGALAITALLTAVVRHISDPMDWAFILLYISSGILAIMSDNLIALAIIWVCIDILDVIILLKYSKLERSNDIVVGLSLKLVGVLLIIWSAIQSVSSGFSITLSEIPNLIAGILIATSILRIGLLPLVPTINESDLSKSIFTISRVIAALSGLILFVYLPTDLFSFSTKPVAILIIGVFSIIFGIPWLLSKNEIYGRSYWILSFGLFIMINSMSGNFDDGISLLAALVLNGSLVSMFFVRNKKNIWIPLIGLWGLTTLPFSLTNGIFPKTTSLSFYYYIPAIVGFSLLIAGYIKHVTTTRSGSEVSQQPKWINLMYQTGLILILGMIIAIGLTRGLNTIQRRFNWIDLIPLGLGIFIYLLQKKFRNSVNLSDFQPLSIKKNPLSSILWGLYNLVRRIISGINFILEGDGGMLWSLVFLVLFLTILTQA